MKYFWPMLSLAPAGGLVATFVLVPLLLILRVSFYEPASGIGFYAPDTFTGGNYALLTAPDNVRLAGFTALFGVIVAMGVVTATFPLALFLRTLTSKSQMIAMALILLPKSAGLLAGLFGLQRLLPRGLAASVLAEIYLILPYAVLTFHLHLRSLEPSWELAARGLGAGRWQVLRRVTLPLSYPGLLLTFQLGLMWGLAAFLGPLFLGGPDEMTLSVEIHRQAFEYGRWPLAAVLSMELLLLVAFALLVGRVPSARRGRTG